MTEQSQGRENAQPVEPAVPKYGAETQFVNVNTETGELEMHHSLQGDNRECYQRIKRAKRVIDAAFQKLSDIVAKMNEEDEAKRRQKRDEETKMAREAQRAARPEEAAQEEARGFGEDDEKQIGGPF